MLGLSTPQVLDKRENIDNREQPASRYVTSM
jgi:hypothetical protein